MKLRIKVYCWCGFGHMPDTYYYQFPSGRVCRVEADDVVESFQQLYDSYDVPFLFY